MRTPDFTRRYAMGKAGEAGVSGIYYRFGKHQNMSTISNKELIEKARSVINPKELNGYTVADVGCALLSEQGNIYLGVCIDVGSSIGFCAEHAAIGSMVTNGEYRIHKVVAVWIGEGKLHILSPCGRCREFIRQIHPENVNTEVIIEPDKTVRLKELLPFSHRFYKCEI